MCQVYLGLGTNLGDRLKNLEKAIALIAKQVGDIGACSSIYKTAAWGNTHQPDFLNMVVSVKTDFTPETLLEKTQQIELYLGRERIKHWGERIIDIDILFYGEFIQNSSNLIIPHPYIGQRKFVLTPLNELIPDFYHPSLKQTVRNLYLSCEDKLQVEKTAFKLN
ncbi:2-amino-4-hydroxy-6-hydroxymethyldihydropteridine diphosphokinase [Pedobacter glucosidilyticus]|uniref:2-amino-4-hydroxy-6- hydroxymethyldihydropteridine diphosphokinase n=1 Tax=Pedobacter glucosidilyticus TaxID=1122941 RepID=UPI000416CC63|nr:2-amino-4-hydroxy-6-hydroxymethyldihydropteridine diphosphokinase [Pedobacter glucosidilyticus]